MSYNFTVLKQELKKAEDRLSEEYSQIHTGRASPIVLDGIMVSSYGTVMPIKNVASIAIEDPKTLRILPWDKSQIKDIEKAIMVSNIGLSVSSDSDGVRAIFPQLTQETRINLVKILKSRLEDARIKVRQAREEVWSDIQKQERDGEMPEDDKFKAKEDLQVLVDGSNNNLELIFNKKEKEVLN